MKTLTSVGTVLSVLVMSSVALAQAPASAPAAASSQPAPHKLVMPPGFKVIQVNGRNALCEPVDEAWVTTALSKIPSNPKPSTQPANILAKLSAQREAIIRAMMADLSTNDPVPLAKEYDSTLTPSIRELDNLHPSIYFLVVSPERLSALMRSGWTDPRLSYNRAADSVSFTFASMLATDRPMDDLVFPATYNPKDPPEKHGDAITASVNGFEGFIAREIDTRARLLLGSGMAQIIIKNAFEPLKPKADQEWFGIGVASILSAKYVALITGEKRDDLVRSLIYEPPQMPLKMSAIDLLHPTDLKNMVPQAVPAYLDTMRRKSSVAVEYLIEKGNGDGAIAKAIATFRDKKPADGTALIKDIKDATGVDLAPAM